MKTYFSRLVVLLAVNLSGLALHAGPTREELFTIPDVSQNPLQIETLSEKEQDGVIVSEVYINGAPFNGHPTKIYAFYARPKAPGKYPGVLQLHGSGLNVLLPNIAIEYAKANYACLSIDWQGSIKGRKIPRKPPFSEFESPGRLGLAVLDATGKPMPGHSAIVPPDQDTITNGVRFSLRAFQFLRSRPEVDTNKLCLVGGSAGAHLGLIMIGLIPDLKAAAVKYGSGYIHELNFGGYFGPIVFGKPDDVEQWLEVLDPKYGLKNAKAATLILSGTDDIFFWMPAVLATYRAIPSDKRLIMRPNDSHTQAGAETEPRRWFDHVLNGTPWPKVLSITQNNDNGQIKLAATVEGDVTKASFWYKVMPVAQFHAGRGHTAADTVPWKELPATQENGVWSALTPAPQPGDQMVAYITFDSPTGAQSSSDSVEIPDYPKWRPVLTP